MFMACSLRDVVHVPGLKLQETEAASKGKVVLGVSVSSKNDGSKSRLSLASSVESGPMVVPVMMDWSSKTQNIFSSDARSTTHCVSRGMRWWEKTLEPNMIEIHSAQQLVDSLLNAGDRLVVVDFYSPGCGGCRALHPKICQLAGSNPDVIFLKVNQEELRTMCYSLHVHVLPFFRFYRGSEGRLCSFSCTNATIKKFKDALAKHGTERCSMGPAKGLDEKELLSLASAGELPLNLPLESTRRRGIKQDLSLGFSQGSVMEGTPGL